MKIRGAVLESIGQPGPYVETEPLRLVELDLAEPGPDELLVKIEAASVCHSDLSVINGDRPRPMPMLLGHEAAGVVEAMGPSTLPTASDDGLRVGGRVVLTFLPRCDECDGCATDGIAPCVRGSTANGAGDLLGGGSRLSRAGESIRHHLGVSGFATHAVVDRRSVVPVDDDVPPDVAALLGCAVLTGGGAVLNALDVRPGQRVAVVGLGGVGVAGLLTALALPDVEVVAVDMDVDKLAFARELGAAAAATPDEALAEPERFKAPSVLEAVGRARAFETAIALTSPGGRTVTVGLPNPQDLASVSPLGLVAEGRTIAGSYLGSAVPRRDVPRFVELWRSGRLPVEKLITDRLPLADVNVAFDRLSDGRAVRQILTPEPIL